LRDADGRILVFPVDRFTVWAFVWQYLPSPTGYFPESWFVFLSTLAKANLGVSFTVKRKAGKLQRKM
jgi:hypothetical protein